MDDEVFRDFFDGMHGKLVRYSSRYVELETARELAADALLTIWRKDIENPRTEIDAQRLQSLAYKVVQGNIRNAQRAAVSRRHAEARLAAQLRESVSAQPWPPPWTIDEIMDHVRELRAADQELLSLYIDGYKTAEIALIVGCKSKAASMRLARALQVLRTVVGEVDADGQPRRG